MGRLESVECRVSSMAINFHRLRTRLVLPSTSPSRNGRYCFTGLCDLSSIDVSCDHLSLMIRKYCNSPCVQSFIWHPPLCWSLGSKPHQAILLYCIALRVAFIIAAMSACFPVAAESLDLYFNCYRLSGDFSWKCCTEADHL